MKIPMRNSSNKLNNIDMDIYLEKPYLLTILKK